MDPLVPFILSLSINDIPNLIVILVCIVLGGFFAAAETGLSQCNKYKLTAMAESGKKSAKVALKIIDKFDNSIINILIFINFTHIIASTAATVIFIVIFNGNQDLASVISTIVITLIIFLFSEMLPKYIANAIPDKVSCAVAIPLYIIGIIITPIAAIFRFVVFIAKKLFRVSDDDIQLTDEDFQDTVEDKIEDGSLEELEVDIINNAVEFGDITVKEVMTPIEKTVMFDCTNAARRDVLKFLLDVEYTRIPVYEKDRQNIIGILHIKKYLLAVKNHKNYFNFKNILQQPLFVNANTKIDDMFEILQNQRTHIAIVTDDNKKVIGMVTMEDVVEEVVGDIDEKNPPKVKLSKLGGRK